MRQKIESGTPHCTACMRVSVEQEFLEVGTSFLGNVTSHFNRSCWPMNAVTGNCEAHMSSEPCSTKIRNYIRAHTNFHRQSGRLATKTSDFWLLQKTNNAKAGLCWAVRPSAHAVYAEGSSSTVERTSPDSSSLAGSERVRKGIVTSTATPPSGGHVSSTL